MLWTCSINKLQEQLLFCSYMHLFMWESCNRNSILTKNIFLQLCALQPAVDEQLVVRNSSSFRNSWHQTIIMLKYASESKRVVSIIMPNLASESN
jgi:hypothetical protein